MYSVHPVVTPSSRLPVLCCRPTDLTLGADVAPGSVGGLDEQLDERLGADLLQVLHAVQVGAADQVRPLLEGQQQARLQCLVTGLQEAVGHDVEVLAQLLWWWDK